MGSRSLPRVRWWMVVIVTIVAALPLSWLAAWFSRRAAPDVPPTSPVSPQGAPGADAAFVAASVIRAEHRLRAATDTNPTVRLGGEQGLTVIAGEVIVKFRDGVTADQRVAFHAQHGTREIFVSRTGHRRLSLGPGVGVAESLVALGRDARVASISALPAGR